MKQTDTRYHNTYPDSTPWSRKIFLLKKGDVLAKNGKFYEVKQVIHSKLEEQPRIVLEEREVVDNASKL